MSFWTRQLENFRTEIIGAIAALTLICAGFIIPLFIPDQLAAAPPGYEDSSWLKNIISILLIGMGILCFLWLVFIHRYMMHRSKKDYMY